MSDAVAYGKYVRFLIDLYKDEGMEVLVNFLEYEDDFSCQQALAYLVQNYATLER